MNLINFQNKSNKRKVINNFLKLLFFVDVLLPIMICLETIHMIIKSPLSVVVKDILEFV